MSNAIKFYHFLLFLVSLAKTYVQKLRSSVSQMVSDTKSAMLRAFNSLKALYNKKRLRWSLIASYVMYASMSAFAQVTLEIDTDPIFTEANGWITTFTPIVAIGIGISIALAILTFVGNKIVEAFRKN